MHRTLLLGAGAAASCYTPPLTTASLTAVVTDGARWEAILREYARTKGTANQIDPTEITTLIGKIAAIPGITFEQLIEHLDKISSYQSTTGNPKPYVLHDLFRLLGVSPFPPSSVWHDIPFLARTLIGNYLVDLPRMPSCASMIARQRDLLSHLLEDGNTLSVFTLNYDESIRESAKDLLDTGFRGKDFHAPNFLMAPNVLGFLHGSLRYVYKGGLDGITSGENAPAAMADRWEGLSRAHDSTLTSMPHPYAPVYDTFIVTGQTKEHVLHHNPFAATHQRFAKDILQSTDVLIVGYSGGDPHINRLIANFLLHDTTTHHLLIFDKHPRLIPFADDNRGDPWVWQRLKSLIGRPSYPIDMRGVEVTDKYPEDIAHINANGFGRLMDGVIVDLRGYDAFLHDFPRILALLDRDQPSPDRPWRRESLF